MFTSIHLFHQHNHRSGTRSSTRTKVGPRSERLEFLLREQNNNFEGFFSSSSSSFFLSSSLDPSFVRFACLAVSRGFQLPARPAQPAASVSPKGSKKVAQKKKVQCHERLGPVAGLGWVWVGLELAVKHNTGARESVRSARHVARPELERSAGREMTIFRLSVKFLL